MKPILLSLVVIIGLGLSTTALAIDYTPIVTIPRIDVAKATTKEYIQALYYLAISAAALIAVVKIIYGGVQYMLDGIVTHKEQARKDIQGALFGLLIVLSAVLILHTINPHLTELDIFGNAPKLDEINAIKPTEVNDPVHNAKPGDGMLFTAGSNLLDAGPFEESCIRNGGKPVRTPAGTMGVFIQCQ